jgi:hypothetical protein
MNKEHMMFTKIVGGNLLLIMGLEWWDLISHDMGYIALIASSVAWLILAISWFDGSKYQRDLI